LRYYRYRLLNCVGGSNRVGADFDTVTRHEREAPRVIRQQGPEAKMTAAISGWAQWLSNIAVGIGSSSGSGYCPAVPSALRW